MYMYMYIYMYITHIHIHIQLSKVLDFVASSEPSIAQTWAQSISNHLISPFQVSIVAYCDSELSSTLQALLARCEAPWRLSVGLVWQGPTEELQLPELQQWWPWPERRTLQRGLGDGGKDRMSIIYISLIYIHILYIIYVHVYIYMMKQSDILNLHYTYRFEQLCEYVYN